MAGIDFSGFSDSLWNYMRTIYPQIVRRLRYSDTMSQYLTTVPSNVEGYFSLTSAEIMEMLQGYQTGFTPSGTADFKGENIFVHRHKGDFAYDPTLIYPMWVSHIEEKRLTPSQHPLAAYVLDIFLERMVEDMQQNSAKGIFKEPVKGFPGQAKNALTGYLTTLRRLISEGKVVPVLVSTFTPSTTREFVEDFTDQIPELYRKRLTNILTSEKNSLLYSRGYREDFGINSLADASQSVKNVHDTIMNVIGDSSLDGEDIFIATMKSNFFRVNSIRNNKPVEAQRQYREHVWLMDGGVAFGFALPSVVFVGGQVISPPKRLLAPSEAAGTLASTTASIRFEEVAGATGYRLDVNTAADFTGTAVLNNQALSVVAAYDLVINENITKKEYLINRDLTGLTAETTYYFRVRAELNGGVDNYTSLNSAVGSFTTLEA